MAKHRIRRWYQFGVLDLLIVTTVASIAAVLFRLAPAKTMKAPPWVIGYWGGGWHAQSMDAMGVAKPLFHALHIHVQGVPPLPLDSNSQSEWSTLTTLAERPFLATAGTKVAHFTWARFSFARVSVREEGDHGPSLGCSA